MRRLEHRLNKVNVLWRPSACDVGNANEWLVGEVWPGCRPDVIVVTEKIREQALSYLDDEQKAALLACEKGLFNLHVTGSDWESFAADGGLIAAVDPEFALEMGLIPTLEQLMAEM